jgi:hypothetical protein
MLNKDQMELIERSGGLWDTPLRELLELSTGGRGLYEKVKRWAQLQRQLQESERMLSQLFARRIGRALPPEEIDAIVRRAGVGGPSCVEDIGLYLDREALAAWLSEPNARGGARGSRRPSPPRGRASGPPRSSNRPPTPAPSAIPSPAPPLPARRSATATRPSRPLAPARTR